MAQEEPPAEPPAGGAEEPAQPPAEEPPAEAPPTGTPDTGRARTPTEGVKPSEPNYSDILVVQRRFALKRHRLEILPTYNITINNAVVRHHGFGAELNFYLSEALFLGVEGTYYVRQTTDRYFLLGVDQRVEPSVNQYDWSAFLHFGYVPFQGKFTFFGSAIGHWELWISAGVGVIQTEWIPRDPGNDTSTNIRFAALLPGIGTRVWMARWLAFDAYIKNYMFSDLLEPTSRVAGQKASDPALMGGDSQFTFNVVAGVGFSIWLPPGFEYKTLR